MIRSLLFIVDGALDRPLLHSQGIPLLKRLSGRGVRCYIQSFESSPNAGEGELASELTRCNITWLPVLMKGELSRWQRVRMIVIGSFKALRLCRREKIDVVHCRSYRPGVMGSLLKLFLGIGFLFDMRGFLIDEQIMIGHWKPKGLKHVLARWFERWCILNADVIVTTSPQFRQMVLGLKYFPGAARADNVISIPNCVDTSRFIPRHPNREQLRADLHWEDRLVIAFAGEARTWEGFQDILDFFVAIHRRNSAAYLALFAYGNLEDLRQMLEAKDLASIDYCLTSVDPSQMPDYLGASDGAVVFRRENPFTQTIASPVKFAEYLACGLPVAINPGIGDTARIVEQYGAGVVIDPRLPEQVEAGAETFLSMLSSDAALRERCHDAAQKELSLDLAEERYTHAYTMVMARAHKRLKR